MGVELSGSTASMIGALSPASQQMQTQMLRQHVKMNEYLTV